LDDRPLQTIAETIGSKKEGMKYDKALWLLSSAAPVVVAFGFSLASPSTVRPSIAAIGAPSSSWGDSRTRRFMFGGSGGGGGGNPLDMVTGMFSPKSSSTNTVQTETVNEGLMALSLVDWDTLRSQLESKMTSDEERHFRANLEKGYGVASPLHKVRLFDKSNDEKDIRVTFYRDSASTF
jgi:glutathione S-transferase